MDTRDESLDALFPVQPVADSKPSEPEAAAPTPPVATKSPESQSPILATLSQAVEGLTYPSETDAPLTPFFWPSDEKDAPSAELVASHAKCEVGEVKSQSVERFFKPVVTEEDWHNEEEKATVKRFQSLQDVVKSQLKNVKVFRIGKVEIQVYLVGEVEGGYAGLATKVVET